MLSSASLRKLLILPLFIFVLCFDYFLFPLQPLPPDEEKELIETLQYILGHGKKVIVHQTVSFLII